MYKPTIIIGDVFQTNSSNDYYGKSKLIITKVSSGDEADVKSFPMPQPLWVKGNDSQDNQWVYFKIEPKIHSKIKDKAKFWWIRDHCHRILTHNEESILLYAESCLVDNYGQMKGIRMNDEDIKALDRFKMEGLLDYGHIALTDIEEDTKIPDTHWVRFTNEAWTIVHNLRKQRADRMLMKRYGTLLSPKRKD